MGWLSDLRWALTVIRARRYRKRLLFSQRQRFDQLFRKQLEDDPPVYVLHPDSFYHVTAADLERAKRLTP